VLVASFLLLGAKFTIRLDASTVSQDTSWMKLILLAYRRYQAAPSRAERHPFPVYFASKDTNSRHKGPHAPTALFPTASPAQYLIFWGRYALSAIRDTRSTPRKTSVSHLALRCKD
jgi:hypothetical protein